jgi:3-methyladenine DNA glycosylase AlkD
MIDRILTEIISHLRSSAPHLTNDQKTRMYRIINSDNPKFVGYGNKHADIEKYVREIHNKHNISYNESAEILQELIKSNVHDEKIAGIFLLNRFRKEFSNETVKMIREVIPEYFDSWAITDTTMIRVVGPFLAKKGNESLAEKTINDWSNSENLWIRRAALVILLKIIMVNKRFNNDDVFKLVERMYEDPEEYIQKGIGWLLKTCSKYEPEIIFEYLMENTGNFPRLILRYASEKLPKEKRMLILKK